MDRDEDEDYFPRSVADFSVDFILASCCLMLNVIATEKDNDKGNVLDEVEKLALPTNNPPSMAARYDATTFNKRPIVIASDTLVITVYPISAVYWINRGKPAIIVILSD